MRDGDIRAALHDRLLLDHEAGTRYVDELGICGTVRVDVAVINGVFSGYELKSDRDTLRRLPAQVEMYSMVFDHATLVIGEHHYSRIGVLPLLPAWWGVMVAAESNGEIVLEEVRRSTWNDQVDPSSLCQLLWREEMLKELALRGLDLGIRSKSRSVLAQTLVDKLPIPELRAIVRHRLKTREGWRQPLQQV